MFCVDAIEKAKDWANRCFPHESCGIIVQNGDVQEYISCANTHEDTYNNFTINSKDIEEYVINGTLLTIIHSHISNNLSVPTAPSKLDMQSQIETDIPWGIIDTDGEVARAPYWFGKHILNQELLGVEFQAGVNDCLTLIRKAYKQKYNIDIPEFPRDDAWWERGENMYIDCFEKGGFRKISKDELKDGDLIISKVRADVLNHGGVYLSNLVDGHHLILHHLPSRLSRREAAQPWIDRAEMFLRHKDLDAA